MSKPLALCSFSGGKDSCLALWRAQQQGDLDVRTLLVDHTQKLSDDPAHRINALELGGGALLALGIYPVSFSWDLFGAPRSIHSTATFKATGADAQIANIFAYDGGRIASMVSASDPLGPNTAAVIGTQARIEIDRVWYTPTSFRVIAQINPAT